MLASLLLIAAAEATTYNIRFCANYEPRFVDAKASYGDDYVTDDSPGTLYPARGAWLAVYDTSSGLVKAEYADWTGTYAGCNPTALALVSGRNYYATVISWAMVNGNYVKVFSDESLAYGVKTSTVMTPTASGSVSFSTPRGVGVWNIALAAGHALYRRNAGLAGQNFNLFNVAGPGGGTEYVRATDRVYVSPNADDKKYIIVHELGHQVAARVNYVGNSGVCSQGSCAADNNYGAPRNGCPLETNLCDGCVNHNFNQQEYASSAFWEGVAHYWAAVAFNNTTESDCSFGYYKDTDWDLDGLYLGAQESKPFAVSCATGPTLAPAADYLGDMCTDGSTACDNAADGNCDNRGTEYDWLRFFWDADATLGVSTTDIYRIVDEADPDTWNDDDVGTAANDPAQRIHDAASTVLGSGVSAWDFYAIYDGVHR